MMFWLPRFLMFSWASKLAPSPMASMAMTEQTPKTIPSTVRRERSLWSQRLLMPRRTARLRRVRVRPPMGAKGWGAGSGIGQHRRVVEGMCDHSGLCFAVTGSGWLSGTDVAIDLAVAQADGAVGVARDVFVMSHEDDGFS